MDLGLFLGRFHPLIIHLPIGIILVALLLEWWGKASRETLQRLWFYGMLTAVLSAFIGWLLAGNGAYAPSTLKWHKWLGFATCIVVFGIWFLYKSDRPINDWVSKFLRLGVILLLGIGGHKGGTLTHGEGYLVEGAPAFIQKMVGYEASAPSNDLTTIPIDSVMTFEHLVNPILQQKCLSCHNPKALNGGLDLSTKAAILNGGDSGVVIEGDAVESELFKRVALSQADVKFMPPKGIPMTYNEMEILKSWIDGGADFSEMATSASVSNSMIQAVQAVYEIDLSPRPWYMKTNVAPADSTAIQVLEAEGYQISSFSEKDNYLKVVLPRDREYDILDLAAIANNIIVLEIKQATLNKMAVEELGIFNNLLRLDLSNSTFDIPSFIEIAELPRLESINLFGTNATDAVLTSLNRFPSLERVYVWQSKVTNTGIDRFKNSRVDVVVEEGL